MVEKCVFFWGGEVGGSECWTIVSISEFCLSQYTYIHKSIHKACMSTQGTIWKLSLWWNCWQLYFSLLTICLVKFCWGNTESKSNLWVNVLPHETTTRWGRYMVTMPQTFFEGPQVFNDMAENIGNNLCHHGTFILLRG